MNTTPPPSGTGSTRRRPIQRSRDDRVVAGVAGGIAEHFDIDPVLVRIGIVVLTLSAGTGLLAYLLAWYFIPEAPARPGVHEATRSRRRIADPKQLAAFGVLGIGLVTLFDRFDIGIDGGLAWPLALIGVGVAVLWSRGRQDERSDTSSSAGPSGGGSSGGPSTGGPSSSGGPSAVPGAPMPSSGAAWSSSTDLVPVSSSDVALLGPDADVAGEVGEAATPAAPTSLFNEDVIDATATLAPPPGEPFAPPAPPAEPPLPPAARVSRRQRRRERSTPFSRASGGLLLTSAGVLALAVRAGWLDGQFDRVLAVALIGLGAFLAAGAFLGRQRGFVSLGVLMICALSIGAASDITFKGGVGDRVDAPTTVAEAVAEHRLGLGTLRLDLSKVPMAGRRVDVAPRVSVGALRIEVPTDVKVVVTSHLSAGEIVLFGKRTGGTGFDRSITVPGASEGSGTLYIRARVGIGQIEVARVGKLITPTESGESAGKLSPRTLRLIPSLISSRAPIGSVLRSGS